MTDTDDGDMFFSAAFADEEPQDFSTLQDAMVWAEDLDYPTGTISFDGEPIIAYTAGDIDVA
jgi:hypothetical protein